MVGTQLAALAMVFFGGLWTGGILIVAVERTNLWRRMPIDQFAVDFRRSVLRVDPMMPILGALAGIPAIYFAFHATGPAKTLAWSAVAMIVLVILGSTLIAEPMNSKFRRLPEGTCPPDAAAIRDKWRAFHNLRTVVALLILACLAGAVIV